MLKKTLNIPEKFNFRLDGRYITTFIIVAFVYFIAARLSLLLAVGTSNATAVWPPSGIALAAIVILGYRIGPAIFLGAFFANILALKGIGSAPPYYLLASLCTAAGNMLEGIAGAYFIRRFTAGSNPFENMKGIFVFIALGCFVSTILSATTGVLSFCLLTQDWLQFYSLWITWWLGDAVGIIIVAPVIIMLKHKIRLKLSRGAQIEAFFVFLVLTVSAVVIFWKGYHLEYVIIPILMWIAFRFGRLEVAAAVLLVSGIAILSTINGAGPLTELALNTSLLYLQSYIGVIAIVTLCLSVLTYERGKSEELRSAVQKQLYDIIDFLPDATFAIDKEGRVLAWNKAIEALTGIAKNEMIGKGDYAYAKPFFGELHPILIDLLDLPSPELEAKYTYLRRTGDILMAESFIPQLRGGQGAHLWVVAAPLFDQAGRRSGAIEAIRDVTEQRHVEHALRESELKHRMLFETANDAIMLMRQDRFIDCNARTLTMYGCSREQIVGALFYEYSPPTQPDRRRSEETALEKINLALTDGPHFFEWEHCRRDGTPFMAEVSLNRMELNGETLLQAIVRDITERKQSEEALRQSEATIQSVFRAAPVGICILQDRMYKSANNYWCEQFGYSEEMMVGQTTRMLYESDEEWQRVGQHLYAHLQENGLASVETRLRRSDGSFRDVIVTAAPIRQDDISAGTVTIIHDITERKQSEEALRQSEATIRSVFRAAPVGICIMKDRAFKSANSYWCEQFGYSEESIIGKTTRMLYESDEEWHRVGQSLYAHLQENGLASVETRLRRSDGSFRDVIVTAAFIRQDDISAGTVAIIHDITERKADEMALNESERKYRELVENANSIILRWTHDGRINFLNEFGQRFFGYSAEEIIGRHVMGTIVPAISSNGDDLSPLMDRICADPAAFEQNVNENMRRNGECVWIAWTNKIVQDAQGRVAEILSVGTDITKLKQAEEAIRELNATLEQRVARRTEELKVAMERALDADRLKSAFLATMSHELRTPLNSIIGFTGILLQLLAGPLNQEQTKQLTMIQESARHLLALINDVLDISKIEAGQLEIFKHSFDMRLDIEDVLQTVMPLAVKKGLSLSVAIGSTVGAVVSDNRRVKQILINLVSNAIKFTEHGDVQIDCRINEGRLETRVRDTGIGIGQQDMDKLFKPFRQIDTGLTRSHEGTGLGLSICKKLVEMLGGSIRVESEPGVGSIFTFTLPIEQVSGSGGLSSEL